MTEYGVLKGTSLVLHVFLFLGSSLVNQWITLFARIARILIHMMANPCQNLIKGGSTSYLLKKYENLGRNTPNACKWLLIGLGNLDKGFQA